MRQEPCSERHPDETGHDEGQDARRFYGVPDDPYGLKLGHDRARDGQRCGCVRMDGVKPYAERD